MEHEATTSKISDDQLFYCRSRGLSEEDAVSMIVNGFCKEVFNELPMEFAVEAQKLLSISLEGAVSADPRPGAPAHPDPASGREPALSAVDGPNVED
jgi:hypothetical protein